MRTWCCIRPFVADRDGRFHHWKGGSQKVQRSLRRRRSSGGTCARRGGCGSKNGSSTTPWQRYTNLKVDYGLSLGGVAVNLFARVSNLFDTKNVINVYSRSGNAYDDGFLTDPALSSEIVAANGENYVDLYQNVNLENRQHYRFDFGQDVFSEPRVVKMGVEFKF